MKYPGWFPGHGRATSGVCSKNPPIRLQHLNPLNSRLRIGEVVTHFLFVKVQQHVRTL